VQKVFAPSTVDEAAQRAAGLIRQESGIAARHIATSEQRFEPLWRGIGSASDLEKRQFISYVEGRSKGIQLIDPKTQLLADEIRAQMKAVHNDLTAVEKYKQIGFIENYYRHQWIKDDAYEKVFPAAKQGSSSFTKERRIPTIEEGLVLGLRPKSLDPVQTSLDYISNARKFIASNKILEQGKLSGDVVLQQLGNKKPFPTAERWVPLEGYLAKRGSHQLYAKEGWARVYNNYISSGFQGAAGELVHGLRRVSNNITAIELGLSGFHATTMVNEAIINDVAKAIMDISKGATKEAITGLVKAPLAPYRLYRTGQKIEQEYLGIAQSRDPALREITDLLTKAGGRAVGFRHAKDYEYTAAGNFWRSYKRGTLKAQKDAYLKDITEQPIRGTMRTVFDAIGKTVGAMAEPLFGTYIPRIKNGAFYDTMAQWIRTNPAASNVDKLRAARQIWDSIDNRFGELVQDNIFWKQHMKQVSMLAMRSYSWNIGTVRELGGGLLDISKHKMTPRVAYTIALPLVYGTVGAFYQFLKTGEKPVDTEDLVAPRTGGTDPATGLPERMIMPGYMKDVFGWYDDPLQTAINKANAFVSTTVNVMRNRDWKGDPISPPATDPSAPYEMTAPEWLKAYFNYSAGQFTPISVRDMYQGRKIGTGITQAEQFFGLRPAGRRFIDPEGYERMERYRKMKEWRSKEKREKKQKSYYGGVEE
jgi:hypothetical protein